MGVSCNKRIFAEDVRTRFSDLSERALNETTEHHGLLYQKS